MPALSLSERLDRPAGRALVVAARLAVAGTFTFAAVPKLLDPVAFAASLANYHALPDGLVGAIAVAVPVLEIVVALALVSGLDTRGAALVAGGMLLAFSTMMGQALGRGIDVDCGCFGGGSSSEIGWTQFARNGALLVAVAVIVIGPDVRWWPATTPAPPRRAP